MQTAKSNSISSMLAPLDLNKYKIVTNKSNKALVFTPLTSQNIRHQVGEKSAVMKVLSDMINRIATTTWT